MPASHNKNEGWPELHRLWYSIAKESLFVKRGDYGNTERSEKIKIP